MCGRLVEERVRVRIEMVWSCAVTSERDLGRLRWLLVSAGGGGGGGLIYWGRIDWDWKGGLLLFLDPGLEAIGFGCCCFGG